MPRALVVVLLLVLTACGGAAASQPAGFDKRVVVADLGNPYELVMGPDGMLWATEKSGRRVVRVDPATGAVRVALELTAAYASEGGQDGVLGLALDLPDVFLSYNYQTQAGERLKIARYRYDGERLVDPVDVLTDLPGGVDHQSGRLRIGADDKLYYAIGDQGANQFERWCDPIQAQRLPTAAEVAAGDWSAYRGKTLRMERDGTVPVDNPVLAGVVSHVFTYGHRNGQGLDFAPDGRLYQSEQGPKTDDEINVLTPGGNYGWPHVAGYRDDKAYTYANWSASTPVPCTALEFSDLDIPPSVPQAAESTWQGDLAEPINTFDTVDTGYDFADQKCAGLYFICWPTLAISSLTYYASDAIPGWRDSLLTTNLKDGSISRLTRDGVEVERLFKDRQRYRDIAISADGRSIYVTTDLAGVVRDADGAPTTTLTDTGAIIEYRWR